MCNGNLLLKTLADSGPALVALGPFGTCNPDLLCQAQKINTQPVYAIFSFSFPPKQFLSPFSSVFPSPLGELTFGVNELINEQHGSAKREPRAAIMRANKGRRRARNEPCHLALTKFAYNTASSERKHTRKLARETVILMKNILDFRLGAELTLQEFAAQAETPKEELVQGGVGCSRVVLCFPVIGVHFNQCEVVGQAESTKVWSIKLDSSGFSCVWAALPPRGSTQSAGCSTAHITSIGDLWSCFFPQMGGSFAVHSRTAA